MVSKKTIYVIDHNSWMIADVHRCRNGTIIFLFDPLTWKPGKPVKHDCEISVGEGFIDKTLGLIVAPSSFIEDDNECIANARLIAATNPAAISELLDRLEAAEKSDAESIAMYRKARDERDALRAKVEMMEKQEPVMWANSANIASAKINQERGGVGDQHTCTETRTAYHDAPLYALPSAQGEVK
jgi:hypothetical protein